MSVVNGLHQYYNVFLHKNPFFYSDRQGIYMLLTKHLPKQRFSDILIATMQIFRGSSRLRQGYGGQAVTHFATPGKIILFRGSSVAEQLAVNQLAVGSNPTPGAMK